MSEINFDTAFKTLTGNAPFPWQRELYRKFITGDIPSTAVLPTGLGKTNVIVVWLVALATNPGAIPRRLVYVVNRRTVVDQSTRVAEDIRERLRGATEVERALWNLCAAQPTEDERQRKPELSPLAISTLRGQFADNREWSADPARPAVIAGTVDMIGSRLLFEGYGVGFKARPLHAGFLGQDSLLVHDEAHLEKPFQDLLEAIVCEQAGKWSDGQGKCSDEKLRRGDFRPMRVMALTATPRGGEQPFELTDEEKTPPEVIPDGSDPLHTAWRRLRAKKALTLTAVADEKQILPTIVDLAWKRGTEQSGARVIVFVRTVEAVADIEKGLQARKVPGDNISKLTGTMRGLERDRQADPRREDSTDKVFNRFLNQTRPDEGGVDSVFLICTSAGEVGVDISADHLVCDLAPFDSMAQRFGRVNRYGAGAARIDVVFEAKPSEKKKDDPFDQRRWLTSQLLSNLHGDASPLAIARLPLADRIAAFTPTPVVLPVSDVLYDAWALTTIRGKMPGRPKVEPHLHGISEWEPPETRVAWRQEVWELRLRFRDDEEKKRQEADERQQLEKFAEELLEDYPLKPHELLRDTSSRVFNRLQKLKAPKDAPLWIVADDDTVHVTTLGELIDAGKEEVEHKTVLLPPIAGGLSKGLLTDNPEPANDVADEWRDEGERLRRLRVWDHELETRAEDLKGMRLVRTLDTRPGKDDGEEDGEPDASEGGSGGRCWYWYVRPQSADDDGSKTFTTPVRWDDHTNQVAENAGRIAGVLLKDWPELRKAIVLAARFHDLGKRREVWQRSIGNPKPKEWYAKSGRDPDSNKLWRPLELTDYRHEFGSLVDVLDEKQPCCTELRTLPAEMQDVVLHLIAVHHGYGRPHFPADRAFDPEPKGLNVDEIASAIPQRFARLQRRYGRWGLAYLESLLRAADYAASAKPATSLGGES